MATKEKSKQKGAQMPCLGCRKPDCWRSVGTALIDPKKGYRSESLSSEYLSSLELDEKDLRLSITIPTLTCVPHAYFSLLHVFSLQQFRMISKSSRHMHLKAFHLSSRSASSVVGSDAGGVFEELRYLTTINISTRTSFSYIKFTSTFYN